jgi:hypothetical protein
MSRGALLYLRLPSGSKIALTAIVLVTVLMMFLSAVALAADADEREDQTVSSKVGLWQEVARGPVRVEVEVNPEYPVIGDVLELELTVTAAEGVEVLMPEFGEALGRFEIVDFAPADSLDANGRSVSRQKYRLQPSRSGPQSIPSLRVEFIDRREGYPPSPEGEDAFEILTDRISLEVTPILEADAPLELQPPHGDLSPRRNPIAPVWVWALVGLAILAAAAPFAWRAFIAARVRRLQRSAYEVARGELDGLLAGGLPNAGRMDAFYVQLSLIVRAYLENRFGLRSPELTTPEFLTEMGRSPDLARSHQKMLRDFLEQADLVKFAGLRPSKEAVSVSVSSAERFLEETRDQVRSETLGVGRDEEGADV